MSENDLLKYKEFALFYQDEYDFTHPQKQLPNIPNNYFHPEVQQQFVSNFINPDTIYKSLHLFHSTGSGKTLGSLNIARSFIRAYQILYKKNKHGYLSRREDVGLSPTVFILGFSGTKKVFKKEIMRFSEFGIITPEEIIELRHRESVSTSGAPSDILFYKEYRDKIKARISNKNKNGFFQFLGYQELVNRLFYLQDIELQDIINHAKAENMPLEEMYLQYLKENKIQVNFDFIKLFNNSLVICDEIHVTYNKDKPNAEGIALQYIIDHASNMRLVTLSATPFKSLPSECIDWANYHLKERIYKKDFFKDERTMYPDALKKFGDLTRGFVSFYADLSSADYPERIFVGEAIRLSTAIDELPSGYELPYLKFIPCKMSELHNNTYKAYCAESQTTKLNSSARSLLDCVFPNPDSDQVGLYHSKTLYNKILSASNEWRAENGVEVKKMSFGTNVLSGRWLQNIAKYSTKYARVLSILNEIMNGNKASETCQKTFIFHPKVSTSGVLLIQELLIQNGFVDEVSSATDYTRCWICNTIMKDHSEKEKHDSETKKHNFIPARFIIVHSHIDTKHIEILLDKYNHPNNKNGMQYGIFIGSKIISESHDFKDVQQMMILSIPVHISSLIQTLGRVFRRHANIALPPEQNKCHVRLLVSTSDDYAPEVVLYAQKLLNYINIQQIECEIISNAVDISIHWDKTIKNVSHEPNIGQLWFPKPAVNSVANPITKRYDSYGYGDQEVVTIIYLIKRLFLTTPVWTYQNLLSAIHEPPIPLNINPKLFTEHNFVIALTFLLNDIMIHEMSNKLNKLVESIFNSELRIIYKDNVMHKIKQVAEYYILFPVNVYSTDHSYLYNISDDLETYIKPLPTIAYKSVNLKQYLIQSQSNEEYRVKKDIIFDRIKADETPYWLLYDYSEAIQMKLIEDIIISYDKIKNPAHEINETKENPKQETIFNFYKQLDVIILSNEVILYKNILKYYEHEPELNVPIGYCMRNTIKLYKENSWFEVNKVELNRHLKYKDNDIIVGMFTEERDHIRFKLRTPAHLEKEQKDRRLLERGLVCTFYEKGAIFDIAASLGISLKKINKKDLKINNICFLISNTLIEREIRERNKRSKYRWIMSWFS